MSRRRILLISGPNLDRLGARQPEVYGERTLDDIVQSAERVADDCGFDVSSFQSGSEQAVVARVHEAVDDGTASIIINPGAFTHYSWAIHDALASFSGPIVEVHISQPQRRERWRHQSVIAPVATATISGCGPLGYELAVSAIADVLDE